jgi:hypothetical protein
MALAAGKGAGVAPKKGKVRREFLTERHIRYNSYPNPCGPIERLGCPLQPCPRTREGSVVAC